MLAADVPHDLDSLVADLRQDHVVVDRAYGDGESQKYHDRLVALVREMPFDVYVALVAAPDEVAAMDGGSGGSTLATLLSRRIGEGAVYVVATDGGGLTVSTVGLDVRDTAVSLGASAAQDQVAEELERLQGGYTYMPGVVDAEATVRALDDVVEGLRAGRSYDDLGDTLSGSEVRTLAAEATVLSHAQWWRPRHGRSEYRAASPGLAVGIGSLLGLVVALLLGQSLAGWPRGRSEPPRRLPRRGAVSTPTARKRAGRETGLLRRRIERDAGTSPADRDQQNRADLALDVAERLLGAGDDADLVGAEMVARAGLRSHDLARGGGGEGYRPCFFDPRHGEAARNARWRFGEGDVEVPCCTTCFGHVDRGREPDSLLLPGRSRPVPYWQRDDVWARTGYGALTDDLAAEAARDLRKRPLNRAAEKEPREPRAPRTPRGRALAWGAGALAGAVLGTAAGVGWWSQDSGRADRDRAEVERVLSETQSQRTDGLPAPTEIVRDVVAASRKASVVVDPALADRVSEEDLAEARSILDGADVPGFLAYAPAPTGANGYNNSSFGAMWMDGVRKDGHYVVLWTNGTTESEARGMDPEYVDATGAAGQPGRALVRLAAQMAQWPEEPVYVPDWEAEERDDYYGGVGGGIGFFVLGGGFVVVPLFLLLRFLVGRRRA